MNTYKLEKKSGIEKVELLERDITIETAIEKLDKIEFAIRGDEDYFMQDRRDDHNFSAIFAPIVDANVMPSFKDRDVKRWTISTDQ